MPGREITLGLRITADGQVMTRVLEEGKRGLNDLGDEAQNTSARMQSIDHALATTAKSIAAAFTLDKIRDFGVGVFEAGARVERLALSLKIVTGSAALAANEMAYISQVSNRLGIDVNSAGDAYVKFTAAARGTNLEGERARAVFESVANASSKLGLTAADTTGVLLALQQMISKGTVAAEELRGQLGERLPGAFAVSARAMGVSTAELGKMLEKGEIVAGEFLPRFAAELDKVYGAGGKVETSTASLTRLGNAWEDFKRRLGEGGGNAIAKAFIDEFSQGLNELSFRLKRDGEAWGDFFGRAFASRAVIQIGLALEQQQERYQAYRAGERASFEISPPKGDKVKLDAFLGDAAVLSAAQKKTAEQTDLLKRFTAAVKDFSNTSPEYKAALAALNQGLENIEQKGSKAARATGSLAREMSSLARESQWAHFNAKALADDLDAVSEINKREDGFQKLLEEARDREQRGLQTQVDNLRNVNEQLRLHNEEIGLTTEALAELTLRRIDDDIAVQEGLLRDEKANDNREVEIGLIEKQIELLKKRRELTSEGQQREQVVAARNQVLDTFRSIDDTAHSVFTSVMTGGENAFKRIGQTIKSAVLDVLYQVTLKRWIIQIAAGTSGSSLSQAAQALGGGSLSGGAGGSFGGVLNAGSSLLNLGGTSTAITGAYTAFATGAAGQALGLSTAGTIVGATQTGAALSGGLTAAGSALGALAAAAPYIAAVVAIASLLMGKGGGPKNGGSGYANTYGASNDAFERRFTPNDLDTVFQSAAAGVLTQVSGITDALGLKVAELAIGIGGDLDPRGDAASRVNHVVLKDGKQVAFGTGDYGRSQEEFQAGIAAQMSGALRDALRVSLAGVDDELAKIFGSFKGTDAELGDFVNTLVGLRTAVNRIQGSTDAWNTRLIALMGGIDAASQSVSQYYDLFFSDAEKLADAQAGLKTQFDALNLAVPASKVAFRSLVEGLDMTTDSGRSTFAALLKIAPAFAQISDAAEQAAQAAAQAAEQQRQAAEQAAEQQRQLQQQAFQAQMQAAQQMRDTFRQITVDLKGFLASLKTGALSDASPETQYLAAKTSFDTTARQASLGNLTALQSLQGVAQSFLEASRGWFASSAGYSKDLAAVEALLTRVIGVSSRGAVRGFASGGVANGLFVAGEAGPELIYSGSPVRVLNNADSRSMLDIGPIVRAIEANTRTAADSGNRLDARLARLERSFVAMETEARLRNSA